MPTLSLPVSTGRLPPSDSGGGRRTLSVGRDLAFVMGGLLTFLSVVTPSRLIWAPLVVLMTILWLTQTSRLRLGASDVSLVLLAVLNVLSLFWTHSASATDVTYKAQIGATAVFLVVRSLANTRRGLDMAAVGYVVGCVVAVTGIYRERGLRLTLGFDSDRAIFEDLNQNYLAYAMCAALVLVILLWRDSDSKVVHTLLLGSAVWLLLGINETGTRGAGFAVVALALWLATYRINPRLLFKVLLSGLSFLALLSLTGAADALIQGRVHASARDTGDLNGRLVVWPLARRIFEDHPWLGIGAGAFRDATPYSIEAHNAFLEIASGLGLVGLVAFGCCLYFPLVRDTRSLGSADRALYAGGLLVVAGPILLSGAWHQAPAAWVVIALISSLGRTTPQDARSSGEADGVPSTPQSPIRCSRISQNEDWRRLRAKKCGSSS